MTREAFVRRYSGEWGRLERMIQLVQARRGSLQQLVASGELDATEFDRLYRLVCRHLSIARHRLYGLELIDELNGLALRAHHVFYGSRSSRWRRIVEFVVAGFPSAVREHRGAMLVSAALFVLPALVAAFGAGADGRLVEYVLSPEQLRQVEEMYAPDSEYRPSERAADTDLQMFGFYVFNNISIAFRTFAGGMLFGIGSMFFLVFNGLIIGAVSAHVTAVGHGEQFWSFVATHSAPELTAIVIAGAAGLNLAYGFIAPGRLPRGESLRRSALGSMSLVYGAAGLLLIAAFVEAFWSSATLVPNAAKYAAGALAWLSVGAYLAFGGRRRAA